MLKALELVGFKSFADRTRFEFPSGITAVVGPNGSGKSNIVDAIKWVLGEQSVKSLRGKEMADVIFNGSGTRRPMNSAEITLTFDNATRLLAVDTPEVHITRRVYRGGEGEYLINRKPARLRDIRDLLAGTGLGTHAYSVIEQGKVDVLLQASPRDRRVIFEEAAGIARFKAKKLEALRRLERVEQNLLRLSDIVDEVESRLRSVRLQAGKARRYREYTGRLQELRTQVGLVDWRRLSDRLAEFQEQLATLREDRDGANARAQSLEAKLLEIDTRSGELDEAIHESEARIAANRERIATVESAIDHHRVRARDLGEEVGRLQRQLVTISARADDFKQQLRDTVETVRTAEEEHRQIAVRLADGERQLTGVIAALDRVRGESEQRRHALLDRLRASAELGNQLSALESEVAAAAASQKRSQGRLAELDRQLDGLAAELDSLRRRRDELLADGQEKDARLADARGRLDELERLAALRQDELAELRERHRGAAERIAVLEELQQRQEGVGAGVKDLLARARSGDDPALGGVCALVADLLSVGVEIAPLVEVALGEIAQHVVARRTPELIEHLKGNSQRLAGRVGFVWLDSPPSAAAEPEIDLEGKPGVIGRADRFVRTEPRYAPLARRLLSRTWFIENLDHALRLAGDTAGKCDFVTTAGDLLRADGTLVVGPRHASTGLISRRAQLEALKSQLTELDGRIEDKHRAAAEVRERIARQTEQAQQAADEQRRAAEALAEHRVKLSAAEDRRAELDRQRTVFQSELDAAGVQHDAAVGRLAEVRTRRGQVEAEVAQMESRLDALNQHVEQMETERRSHDRQTTEVKVELAKSEERLRNLHARMRQFEEGRRERSRAVDDTRTQLTRAVERLDACQRSILQAESQVAELYLHKEHYAAATVELINRRELEKHERVGLGAELHELRARLRGLEERIHEKDLAASEVRHERGTLADRLREDYGIELSELEHEPTDEERHQRDEVQQEIDELRRKINNLGNVNVEALEELDALESRHGSLSGQYQDLVDAKDSLVRIIDRINTDSRRLFAETLEVVRGHFQTLFRDLFGGGQADIVLEDEADVLESGIEIVARPPGKEPRSISLLSGGEKTLTCVALLLAIFRSRPSPFCVLDEVDAALDEANIDRFIQVLQDFLSLTQFVIVTHSKKTMTCADTMYGVTMQESGVSKQVSVRFEDVSEDGHISEARLREAAAEEAVSDDGHQAA
jgi:chromosome segregation protein